LVDVNRSDGVGSKAQEAFEEVERFARVHVEPI
jgi:hypothetical protein